jgi:hypothetical protein
MYLSLVPRDFFVFLQELPLELLAGRCCKPRRERPDKSDFVMAVGTGNNGRGHTDYTKA